jgi:alkanesulfonate monooxygenase SsuD/methylene tetrahydromethanopterin reductase-like flavin-dependent oxidoreductase (luciferase family)
MPAVPALGYVVRPEHPPEDLPELARRVEAAGFDELWVWEDCFWAGGIATTGAALAATSTLRVGLGITPAPMRNPATLAMEIAALARLYPGRFLPGVGHGVAEWIRQIGALPASQLGLIEEVIAAVRGLLAGEELTVDGRYVKLDRVKLEQPPAQAPPVSAGVRRPKSLAISGRVADGTILAEPAPVEYVEWARERIAATRPHRLTVYAWYAMDADGAAARESVREVAAGHFRRGGPHVDALGLSIQDGEPIRDEWIDRLGVVVGTPEECATGIRALAAAGADAIPLCSPHPKPPAEDIERLGRELLPLLPR